MIKIIFIDIDGTLSYDPKERKNLSEKIPKDNFYSIVEASEQGIEFSLATGRESKMAENFVKLMPCESHLIACSGGLIYNKKSELIYEKVLPKNIVRDIYNVVIDDDIFPIWMTSTSTHIKRKYYDSLIDQDTYGDQALFIKRFCTPYDDFEKEVLPLDIIKLDVNYSYINTGKTPQTFIDKLDINVGYSLNKYAGDLYIEILDGDISKGNSIEKYIKILGYEKHEVAVIGDSPNDISMFNQFYENSYCVINTDTKLHNARKYAKNHVNSVAEAIESILNK